MSSFHDSSSSTDGFPLNEVRAQFEEHAVGRLLVVDTVGQLLGIVAWSDLPVHAADGTIAPSALDLAFRP